MSAMHDPTLPLTLHEYDEWGDPNDGRGAEAMIRSWCPYENVRRQAYPALLLSASVNDARYAVYVELRAVELEALLATVS